MENEIKCDLCDMWVGILNCYVSSCCKNKYCSLNCHLKDTFRCRECNKWFHVCNGYIDKKICDKCA